MGGFYNPDGTLQCFYLFKMGFGFLQCPLKPYSVSIHLSDLADVYLVAAGAADGDAHLAVPGDVLAHVDLGHHRVRYLEGHGSVDRVLEAGA